MEHPNFEKEFTPTDVSPFNAYYQAVSWLKLQGISHGPMCRNQPMGLIFGDVQIAKWRNLSDEDRAQIHGALSASRYGCAKVVIKPEYASMLTHETKRAKTIKVVLTQEYWMTVPPDFEYSDADHSEVVELLGRGPVTAVSEWDLEVHHKDAEITTIADNAEFDLI